MWDTMESASAGLVEIQSLLAPPRQQGARGSRRSDTRPRRSGRIAARESCASCGEGGDLLSCDRCPAAFHLRCCNPPLSEEMLPPGDWMCHRCVARRKVCRTVSERRRRRGPAGRGGRGPRLGPRC
uniref:PHD finger protein 12 n=1 Tax=Scleropages formosus TaxID=113540 RepID=A0A8C9TID7_SCLFO